MTTNAERIKELEEIKEGDISVCFELETRKECQSEIDELKKAYNLRNDDAKDYSKRIHALEEAIKNFLNSFDVEKTDDLFDGTLERLRKVMNEK